MPKLAFDGLIAQKEYLASVKLPTGPRNLVFPNAKGKIYDATNISRLFYPLQAEAGLPRIRWHDLRHTMATLLLAQNVPARIAMEIMGHSQVTTTLGIYSHVMPSQKKEAMERLNDIFLTSDLTFRAIDSKLGSTADEHDQDKVDEKEKTP